ncbi:MULTISPECIES: type II toxin-antitoxin system RelE/ParE family toxin [Streptococcus]|uniref:Type II toxin-antitoxin system RelE/ParE family toxin n=1 Tax=Streptococcus caledonicus TaxID=2614158 RepID=A0ABW0UBJ6_9STRE|nr:hypothetical protein [Streptococcus sp. S784/96/1]
MVYEIILTPKVEQKLFDIQDYIAEHFSQASAEKKLIEIVESISILEVVQKEVSMRMNAMGGSLILAF